MTCWYAVNKTVYAQRGDHQGTRDPVVALCISPTAAAHIAQIHNTAETAATRIVTRPRGAKV